MHEHFGDDYFQQQIAKSDGKIAWQYTRMLRFAGITATGRTSVLDVGCGAAPGLRFLHAAGAVATGADISAAALRAARRLLPEARLVRCDVERALPFGAERFDAVLLSEVVEHVACLPTLLAECRRVLRPGGALVLTTPNRWDVRRLAGALGGPTWTGHLDPTHINLQTPVTVRDHLRRAGFRAVRVRAGWKPLLRLGGRRLPLRLAVPYPPLIGNGLMASGRA